MDTDEVFTSHYGSKFKRIERNGKWLYECIDCHVTYPEMETEPKMPFVCKCKWLPTPKPLQVRISYKGQQNFANDEVGTMNRREFLKRAGRLLAAIPFVALADLELESEPTEIPFKLMPADGTIYTTTHPTGTQIIAVHTMSTGTSTADILDNTKWDVSPAFQFWHEGSVLWGAADNDSLELAPRWTPPR